MSNASELRILVVDDNTEIHNDFRKLLDLGRPVPELSRLETSLFGSSHREETNDFELTFARDGQEALRILRTSLSRLRPLHVAFVDVRMPGWDGIETAEHLWAVRPELEIVICTAYMDYTWQDVMERFRRPGLRMLHKPYTSGEVLAVILEARNRISRAAHETRTSHAL